MHVLHIEFLHVYSNTYRDNLKILCYYCTKNKSITKSMSMVLVTTFSNILSYKLLQHTMRIITLLYTLLLSLTAVGQISEPIVFSHKINQSENKASIVFDASIDEGWHVYSIDNNEMIISATFNIEKIEGCQLDGKLIASGDEIKTFDNMFNCEVRYFEKKATFTQNIIITDKTYYISGYLEYGACNNESCLPPTAINFTYSGSKQIETTTPVIPALPLQVATYDPNKSDTLQNKLINDLWTPVNAFENTSTETNDSSLWIIFITSFLGGFIALLTPCVWPIIPMTVSFFLKRSNDKSKGIRDSLTYGLSIIVIYVSIGVVITTLAGPSALNALSTNAIFNIFFTAMLIIFGLSFLGAFELNLPTSWSNTIDRKAEKTTGLLSIFLMAFTLALVSFSCTGPIIGFLLVELATSGSFVAPMIGMLGFALALALPFTIFALFPQMMKKMPRSGNWMETMKVMLGFIEIAFALKFFSVADLAYGWNILDREVFIVLWIVIALAAGLYLWRIIKLDHDENTNSIGILRLIGGMICISFAIYLVPGLWGAPLKAVSAFTPPMYTQDFILDKSIPHSQFNNYEEGMQAAKLQNKPVLLDFTGYGCVNCREMETSVWSDPEIANIINNDFILISLYVDDKTPLNEKITIKENTKETVLRTIGDKWSYLQRYKFGVNAQPYYVILDEKGNILGKPHHYDLNIDKFKLFLTNARDESKLHK